MRATTILARERSFTYTVIHENSTRTIRFILPTE